MIEPIKIWQTGEAATATQELDEAINAVPGGIAVWDGEDRLVYANAAYLSLAPGMARVLRPGITFEDMLREGAAEGAILVPDGQVDAYVAERLRIHSAGSGSVEIAARDGRWLQINETRSASGGIITCSVDVTAIRRREDELRARHDLFKTTLDMLDQGLCVFDRNLCLLLWNRRYIELCCLPDGVARIGTPLAELMRISAQQIVSDTGDPEAILKARLAEVSAPGKTVYRRVNSQGKTLLVASERLPDDGLVATFTDITAMQQSEEALRESEQRLRSIADNLPGVVYQRVLKADGHIDYPYISEGVRKVFGPEMTPERVQQDPKALLDAVAPDERAGFMESVQKSAAELSDWDREVRFIATDGTRKWMRARSRPRRAQNGDVIWDGILLDISAHKAAAAEMAALEAQLNHAQKLEALGNMVGGITHEINNALTPIIMYSELVAANLPADGRDRRNLHQVEVQAQRIKDLVSQILAFSHSGDQSSTRIDLVQGVDLAFGMIKSVIPSTIGIEVSLAQSPIMVKVEQARLTQLLTNLVTNAAQAIGTSLGRISVAVSTEPAPTGIQSVLPAGRPCARLRVADTGVGMDRATIARIFDPFFTTRPVGQGTGLGLSTVQRMVRNWNGAITVVSELGRGACFDVYLPLSAEPAAGLVPVGRDAGAASGARTAR